MRRAGPRPCRAARPSRSAPSVPNGLDPGHRAGEVEDRRERDLPVLRATGRPGRSGTRPRPRVRSIDCRSRVLPTPASPARISRWPRPAAASAIRRSARLSRSSRPTRSGLCSGRTRLIVARVYDRADAVIGRSTDMPSRRAVRAPHRVTIRRNPGGMRCSRSTRSARRPRRCSTTTSTAACGPRRSSTSRASTATPTCRRRTSTSSSAWFRRGADRKSLELYLETFQHTFGVMQHYDAIVRVAAECAEDLAADGVVYAEVRYAPELSVEKGLTLDEVVRANLEGFRLGRGERGRGRPPDHDPGARDGDAPGGPLDGDRRARGPLARRGRGRVRHRGSRGGLPADPPPRRVRARPPRELPHHDPRGRVVRAAVDLGGAPVLRRRAARPRRPDRRRHHGPRRRLGPPRAASPPSSATRGSRSSCARPRTSTPAARRRSPSTRSTCSGGSGSGSRSTPTTG